MVVNMNGSIINLREKLLEVEKRKGAETGGVQKNISNRTEGPKESRNIADIIAIKKENILASGTQIRKDEQATEVLNELRDSFSEDTQAALQAHKKADVDRILKFYPFE